MLNPFKDTDWNPDFAARRKFARSLVIGFPILAMVMLVVGRVGGGAWKPHLVWLGVSGCAVGLTLWALPQIAKPFYLVWYFLSCCIGIVLSNLLVAAFFILVLTPTGLIFRALRRDPMARRFEPDRKSYWRPVEKVVDPARYFRQF